MSDAASAKRTTPVTTNTTESLDELRNQILTEFKQVLRLAPADYTENCTNVVMSMIARYSEQKVLRGRVEELKEVSLVMGFVDEVAREHVRERLATLNTLLGGENDG